MLPGAGVDCSTVDQHSHQQTAKGQALASTFGGEPGQVGTQDIPYLTDLPVVDEKKEEVLLPPERFSIEIEIKPTQSYADHLDEFVRYTARAVAEYTKLKGKALEGTNSARYFLEYMIGRGNAITLIELLKQRETERGLPQDDWAPLPLWLKAAALNWERMPTEIKDKFIQQAEEDAVHDPT